MTIEKLVAGQKGSVLNSTGGQVRDTVNALVDAVNNSSARTLSNGVFLVDFPEKPDAGEWINDAITYAFNNKFDYVQLPNDGRSLIVNTTIRLRRGVALLGGAVFDNQNGTVLTRGANFAQPVIATDKWFEPANPVESHYYAIEGICIKGNKANNSTLVEALAFWGVFVGSYIDNLFILENLGPAISYSRGYDCKHGLVWINNCTVGSRAAIEIDQTLTAAGPMGILEFDSLYVENTGLDAAAGSPQTTATNRGDAIKAGNIGRLSITNLHAEACDAVLNVTHGTNDCVTIAQFSGAWLGDNARLNSYIYMSQSIRGLDIGKGRTTDKSAGYKIIGVSSGVASSNQYKDVPSPNPVFGGISVSTLDAGYISNTIAYNNFTQEVVGGVSSLSHRLQTSNTDATRYHFIKGASSIFSIGSRFNQTGDVDFISIESTGNAGDKITLLQPARIAQRSTAGSVSSRSIYEFTNGSQVGPCYQRVGGSNDGGDYICTAKQTNDAAAPAENALYIGQIFITKGSTPRQAYIAVQVGTGATDWRQIT